MKRSKTLQKLLTYLNQIYPKKNIIIFNSYPPFSDNSLALYKYIVRHRPDIMCLYQVVWGQEKNAVVPDELKSYGANVIHKKSLHGIVTFLSAKYIMTTHGYFPGVRSGNGQIQVNLWHGCGYKAITENDSVYNGDINIVTGKTYVSIHEKVFKMKPGSVYATGLPRNDLLFQHTNILGKVGINKSEYKKIYIWMPTYRKAKLGHDEIDGEVNSFTIATMTKEEIALLNQVLMAQNFLLIIKPHPMDSKGFENIYGFSNIKAITNEILFDKHIQLYELLSETSGLLSDYSSVVIDYLLLHKPIAMVMSDIDAYKSSRGFVFDNIKDYLPGPVITDTSSLLDYFQDSEGIDFKWIPKREELTKLLHDFSDDHSCERVCNLIFGEYSKS